MNRSDRIVVNWGHIALLAVIGGTIAAYLFDARATSLKVNNLLFVACVACVVDAHCTGSDRPRCDAALHRCVECGLPSDCDARETCQPDTRRCVTACVDASACPSGAPICDAQRGFCLECRVDTDCREGDRPSCDARAGRCVACRTDADCKKGEEPLCNEEGSCVECRTSLDCPADKPLCDPARWECKGS